MQKFKKKKKLYPARATKTSFVFNLKLRLLGHSFLQIPTTKYTKSINKNPKFSSQENRIEIIKFGTFGFVTFQGEKREE